MKFFLLLFSVLVFPWQINSSCAQDSTKCKILTPSLTLNKTRVYTVAGSWTAIYSGVLIGFNELWYKNYPRSSFHFFNDSKEWQQIDKVGHAYASYFESKWSIDALRWAGVENKKAIWIGGFVGPFFQTTVEILDGFSEKWGASWFDLVANQAGAFMVIGQELAWHEQRIVFKYSAHTEEYHPSVQQRVNDLYGIGFWQTIMKDYNGQDYWLSANPYSFMKEESKFPKWLNVAVGYGAGGMLGGFENKWTEWCITCFPEKQITIDRSDIIRYRKFFIAPDIDFTRIKTESHLLKFAFGIMNILKFPAPAIEFNTKGEILFHPVYALNWSKPLHVAK